MINRFPKYFIYLLLYFFSNYSFVFAKNDSLQTKGAVVCIEAKSGFATLNWFPEKNKSVLILASENNNVVVSETLSDYSANSHYGKGPSLNGAFVIYTGNESSVTVSGLKKGKKYYFTFYEISAEGFLKSNSALLHPNPSTNILEKPIPQNPNAVVTCVCPAIAGITCTLTGTTNSGPSVSSAAACPHVGYCDAGTNNSWSSAAGTGTLQYMFSAPVSAATLRANSVNDNDKASISATGGSGGTLSVTGVVCMTVAGLVIGPLTNFTTGNDYGGVSWTVNSTGSYTNVILLNTGAQSGWVSACPTAITAAPLPIELVSLNGMCAGKNIHLKWQTASEKNNSYFTIERSFNTEDWEEIGKVPGAGNSNQLMKYEFTDVNTIKGNVYYRLKQTDVDGRFKLSELIAVESCKGVVDVMVYPNPAKDIVNVKCASAITLEIYNMLGEKLSEEKLTAGTNQIDISVFSNGTYFFKLSNTDATLQFSKVVISR